MKEILSHIFYWTLRFLLLLRYRIKVKMPKDLKLKKPGGILFLSNHPAEIDPCILFSILWPRYRPHPVAIEYLFQKPGVRSVLEFIEAIPIPNFDESSNSYKQKQIDATYEKLRALLERRQNLLVYPGGGLKRQAEEIVGGASGIKKILEIAPDTNVVLVRIKGLWGSSFSRALTGRTPEILGAIKNGAKILLKNLIFFAPRRSVEVEIESSPEGFSYDAPRREMNRYLEEWFNRGGSEPLSLVSYSFWKKDFPEVAEMQKKGRREYGDIPLPIQQKVKEEIAQLTNLPLTTIKPEQELSQDLGLDSLDQAQLGLMLKEQFGVTQVNSSDLHTVESVMAFAAGIAKGEKEPEEDLKAPRHWEAEEKRPAPFLAEGKTIPEAFLRACEKMGDQSACADLLSGEVSYKRLKLGVLLMSQAIAKLPGEKIGVLLPASTAVNVVVLAILFAGKVPVMINWTLGPRNLQSVLEQSKIKKTISSWAFLDRLENVDLNGLDDQLVLLEDLRRSFTFKQKAKAVWFSHKNADVILKRKKLHRISEEAPAVILFTSGTESVPKGVPLSHKNLLSNQKDAFNCVIFKPEDVLLGALPSFHSFGFSVTGLLPILSGLRVVFSPNPTDGRRLALSIDRWKVTLVCLAPTFLKNLFRVATAEQLKTLRLVVSGAERASPELIDRLKELNPSTIFVEGYGITECAPILTLNRPDRPSKGAGLPLPQVEILIVHPETLEPLSLGKEGLILARGPNVFSGYLDSSLPSPFVNVLGKEWYQTGDLGFIDENGYVMLSGRLKRFIKIGGEMISLNAIEEELVKKGKQKGWTEGDVPSLAVIPIEEGGKKSEIHLYTTASLALDEVNQVLKSSGMSNIIRISAIKKVPFIPLLGTGKVDYRTLKERFGKSTI